MESAFMASEWALICVSVGDCKAFVWNDEEGSNDVTFGNRANSLDVRDSGGRVGPFTDGGYPDLRNLRAYFYPCKPGTKNIRLTKSLNKMLTFEGDIVIAVSDGVYDNLDPEHLGFLPADLQIPEFQSWDQMPLALVNEVKTHFMCEKMNEVVDKCKDKTPMELTKCLVKHALNTTEPTRSFMESHPNETEPQGYKQYPGWPLIIYKY